MKLMIIRYVFIHICHGIYGIAAEQTFEICTQCILWRQSMLCITLYPCCKSTEHEYLSYTGICTYGTEPHCFFIVTPTEDVSKWSYQLHTLLCQSVCLSLMWIKHLKTIYECVQWHMGDQFVRTLIQRLSIPFWHLCTTSLLQRTFTNPTQMSTSWII